MLDRPLDHLRLGRRALALLTLTGLVACAQPYPQGGVPASTQPVAGTAAQPHGRIAALLPLTGPTSEVGQAQLKAIQLSLGGPARSTTGAQEPAPFDVQDTRGTAEGAATAARTALSNGAGIILGPLTAPETEAVTPVTTAAGVPVLAFTSDVTKGRPGVWPLGITPRQQVRRLVQAAQAEGRTRFAAIVPDNPFGNALADGLAQSTAELNLPPPVIRRYTGGFNNLSRAFKEVSDYDRRHPAKPAEGEATPPPPFDALLLQASPELMAQAGTLLPYNDIVLPQVRVLGPALWARDATRLSAFTDAWYAAPDPSQRAAFEQRYNARFHQPPRDFASLAYDAAGIARSASGPGGVDPAALLRPEGFSGADGLIALLPDGRVRRGLAIFEIDRGGSHIVQPSPTTLAAPGS